MTANSAVPISCVEQEVEPARYKTGGAGRPSVVWRRVTVLLVLSAMRHGEDGRCSKNPLLQRFLIQRWVVKPVLYLSILVLSGPAVLRTISSSCSEVSWFSLHVFDSNWRWIIWNPENKIMKILFHPALPGTRKKSLVLKGSRLSPLVLLIRLLLPWRRVWGVCRTIDGGKQKCSEINLLHCQFFHYQSHVECTDFETGPPRLEASGTLFEVWN